MHDKSKAATASASLPRLVSLANRAERVARRFGINTIPLRLDSLIEQAQRQTGCSNFFDYDFLTPAKVLLDTYEREADLSLLGRVSVRTSTLLSLTTQLEIQREFELHPEILETPIEKPIFILGFPRTGTTLLHNVLGEDVRARSPKLWQLQRPAPAVGPESSDQDERARLAKDALTQTYRIVPQLQTVHAFDAVMPEECVILLRKIFTCASYCIDTHVPSYFEWFLRQDLLPTYRELKKMFQLLMWKFPGKYPVLKSPLHLFAVDVLLDVFPDARIIQTHRHPLTVAASGCSLYEALRTIHMPKPNLRDIGDDWLRMWGQAMQRAMAQRRRVNPKQFYDLHYEELVSDPMPQIQKIYAHFGLEFNAETARRGQQWIDRHPATKHGTHRYDPARYGIDEGRIEQHFLSYMREFDL